MIMEKERSIQCVPVDFVERLRVLAAKFWEEKNPASVHLNALLEEFGPDIKSLSHIIEEYESDYSGRLEAGRAKWESKEAGLRKEIEDLRARLARTETSRGEALKRLEALRALLSDKEAALAELKMRTSEAEESLNSKYVARMQELYEKVSRKELDMLARWEEKNKDLETRTQEFETARDARDRQLKIREKELEEEFLARKSELIRTFDRIREGLEAREKALAGREAKEQPQGKRV